MNQKLIVENIQYNNNNNNMKRTLEISVFKIHFVCVRVRARANTPFNIVILRICFAGFFSCSFSLSLFVQKKTFTDFYGLLQYFLVYLFICFPFFFDIFLPVSFEIVPDTEYTSLSNWYVYLFSESGSGVEKLTFATLFI